MATDAGKKVVEKAANTLSTPKSQVANAMILPEEITKEVNEVLAKYVDISEQWILLLHNCKIYNSVWPESTFIIYALVFIKAGYSNINVAKLMGIRV